ncbi:hypothetical protein TNCV_4028441 [Trichonephila clavipes]|nr:hypothetical protein TNCV_4028441 [Trichonephila clavipes]
MKARIWNVLALETAQMLQNAWNVCPEMEHRLDVVRVIRRGLIEHLYDNKARPPTSRLLENFLEPEAMQRMDLSACFPDLNIT